MLLLLRTLCHWIHYQHFFLYYFFQLNIFIYLHVSMLLCQLTFLLLCCKRTHMFLHVLCHEEAIPYSLFMRFHSLNVDHSTCANRVLFRKSFTVPMCWRLFPNFSFVRFSVSGFMSMSLIHLEFSFMWDDKYGSIWIFLYSVFQFDKPV